MMYPSMNKLLIIRGPSGAGKSTVARELLKRSTRPTLLVSEDQIRKMFSDHHKTGHETAAKLAENAVQLGLADGYDVIFEGILNLKTTGRNLATLIDSHDHETYVFYLDVSLEQTKHRHSSRPEQDEFNAEAMDKWWSYASPTQHDAETIIPEASSVDETVMKIDNVANLELKKS